MVDFQNFKEIWLVDFIFTAPLVSITQVRCLVAHEYFTHRQIRIFIDDLKYLEEPCYVINRDCLVVTYCANEALACHLALNWSFPCYVLDLFVEFRNLTNGKRIPCGNGLSGALAYFGLDSMHLVDNKFIYVLAHRGGIYTETEKQKLFEYCVSKVDALILLFKVMLPKIDLPRALLRGRYMKAVAKIEFRGIPLDIELLKQLQKSWTSILEVLIDDIDQHYGVYEGKNFRLPSFINWLTQNNIAWPLLPSGALDLKVDTFREMAKSYPILVPLSDLQRLLSTFQFVDLAVGDDDRNRSSLSPFSARTSRNQSSSSQFIFGRPVWLRGLIMPKPGYGIAYLDWKQQEFGIAAALSNDPLMLEAYSSGDPYLAFAKHAGAVPQNASKQTHPLIREQFKACILAVQYGMGETSLAKRLGQPIVRAQELLSLHKQTYRQFWKWSEAVLDYAMIHGKLNTVFGWTVQIDNNTNPRFIRNFLMQGNGAEMLRLACCSVTESGIHVCAVVHDAILIEAPLDQIEQDTNQAQFMMSLASEAVLTGFKLSTDATITRYPDRFKDDRGEKMWNSVNKALNHLNLSASSPMRISPVHERTETCSRADTRTILLSDMESF